MVRGAHRRMMEKRKRHFQDRSWEPHNSRKWGGHSVNYGNKNDTKFLVIIGVLIFIIIILMDNGGKLSFNGFANISVLSNSLENPSNEGLFSSKKLDDCPQINTPLIRPGGMRPQIKVTQFEGWSVSPYDSNYLLGMNFGVIYCNKGRSRGQNVNYFYCGDNNYDSTIGLVQKTMVDEDGQIGRTIRRSFYNVYDENENFLETVCGEDPEIIAERELDNFLNSYW